MCCLQVTLDEKWLRLPADSLPGQKTFWVFANLPAAEIPVINEDNTEKTLTCKKKIKHLIKHLKDDL